MHSITIELYRRRLISIPTIGNPKACNLYLYFCSKSLLNQPLLLYYVPRHHWFSVSFYVAAGVNIFVIRTLLLEDYLTKIFRITLKTYKTHQLPYVAKVTQNQYIQYHSYRMPIHFYNPKMPYTNLIIWLCPIVSKLHNVKEVKHKTTATLFTCYNFYFTWT